MNSNTQEFIIWVTGHDRETVEQLYTNWQHSNYNSEYITRKEFDAMAMVVKLHIKSIDKLKKEIKELQDDV